MPAKNPDTVNEQSAEREVRGIYRELAERAISRSCTFRTECCQFRLTGKIPHLTRGEALVAVKALRASGRKSAPLRSDGSCPMLDPGTSRCWIYEGRPFGCRTDFCDAAGGPYDRRDVIDLIRRLEEVDARLQGHGPQILTSALADILTK